MTHPSSPPPATCVAVAVALALAGAGNAHAADASDALQEVVVTASRRAQNVVDVPYNISAISGVSLEAANVVSLTDISRMLPGISVPDLGPRASSSNSNIVIRGLNANDPIGSAYLPWGSVPLVSTYVDDVPLFVNVDLSDVARVEVLRGPQGTLYGSGAVAGTIRVIHNTPDPTHFSASATVDDATTSHASGNSFGTNGVINIPLSETAALRIGAGYRDTAGFINAPNAIVFGPNYQPQLADPANPLTSALKTQALKGVDSARSSYLRVAALWHVTPAFDASLSYQRQDDHSNGFSRQTVGAGTYTDQAFIPIAPDHRVADIGSLVLTGDVCFATVISSTSYTRNHDSSGYDETPFLQKFDALSPLYYGSFPRPTTEFITDYTDKSFVEELRLVSKEGGAVDYTVGGFYRHQTNDLFQYEIIPGFAAWSELPGSADAVNAALNATPGNSYAVATFGDYIEGYNGGTRPSALSPTDTNYTYARTSGFKDKALFGELTWHATQKWQVTGGFRLFWQDVSQNVHIQIPYGGPYFSTLPAPANATDALGTTLASGDQGFHNHLFKLNTSYALTGAIRAYATYSEGFRHGGVNAVSIGTCPFCDSANTASFKPDTVKNYEAGLKGTVGNWLRFSGDVYRMKWNDIQVQLFNASSTAYVANGGEARSQGVELEFEAQLSRAWSATLGYGHADARVVDDFLVTDRGQQILAAQSGDRLPYVPAQTLTAGVSHVAPVADGVVLEAHADVAYHSDLTTQINDTVAGFRRLGGFSTVNASAALVIGGHWRASLYATNLTNVLGVSAAGPVLNNAGNFPGTDKYMDEFVIRPRTVGLSVQYRFE